MASVIERIEFAAQDVVEFDCALIVGEKKVRFGKRLYAARVDWDRALSIGTTFSSRGRLTKCGDRPIKFTLKKSDHLVHFRGIPPYASGDSRAESFPPLARTQSASKSCAGCGKFSAV